MYGGCDTCRHSWGEENCRGCLWDGKSRTNSHWEPEELDITTPKKVVGKMISIGVLDKIRAEIEQDAYPIVHGVNNHELGMTLYGILQIIDRYTKDGE